MTPALLGNLGVNLALVFSLLGLSLALLAYFQGDGRFLKGAKALLLPTFLAALAAFFWPWNGPFSPMISAWPMWPATIRSTTPFGSPW